MKQTGEFSSAVQNESLKHNVMSDNSNNYMIMTINWRNYYDIHDSGYHSVVGQIKIAQQIDSPQLKNKRDILVYLPPSYDTSQKRYPVLYMHDGQNLFDSATSYAGEWRIDESMEHLAHNQGREGIIVAIPNAGANRTNEYSPFYDDNHGGGKGDAYLAFIVNTVKPMIDDLFRTRPEKQATGLMGSSLGGLISLYGFFAQSQVFGFAGIMSPSLWFARGQIFHYIEHQASFHRGKIYLDVGTRELGAESFTLRSRRYYANVRRMKRLLVNKGYRPVHDMLHIEEKWANHNEAAWARRFPKAMRFFLDNVPPLTTQ